MDNNTGIKCPGCGSTHHNSNSRPVGSRFSIGSRPGAFRHPGQTKSYPTRQAATQALVDQHSNNL